jgi:hypothetical protein
MDHSRHLAPVTWANPLEAPGRPCAPLDSLSAMVGQAAPRIATQRPSGASQGQLVADWAADVLQVN